MIVTYTDKTYRITYDAVSMIENALDNPNLIQISVISGCTIMVAPNEYGITYLPNGDFQSWDITGVNTALTRIESHHIYARLKRADKQALFIFSINDYTFDGKIVGVADSEASEDYYYVKVGNITKSNSPTAPTLKREISFDGGYLNTPQDSTENSSGWNKLFALTADNLINALKHFASFVVRGTLSIVGQIVLNDRTISNIQTEESKEEFIDDEAIPTTKYLYNKFITFLFGKFIRKDKDDGTPFSFHVGESGFVPGIKGAIIDKFGDSEMGSLILRKFLSVPELRYNRITVFKGKQIISPGGGCVVQSFTVNSDGTWTIVSKLEEGEPLSQFVDDILLAYWHDKDVTTGAFKGFREMKFRVIAVDYDAKTFIVSPKPDSQSVPSAAMTMAQVGNFTNKERQTYIMIDSTLGNNNITFFDDCNTWDVEEHQEKSWFGKKKGRTVSGIDASVYSAVLQNIIMSGLIFQIDEISGDMVRVPCDKGAYVPKQRYAYYDRVSHAGALWLCVNTEGTDSAPTDGNVNWLKQVSEGEKGDAGESIRMLGHWNSSMRPVPANCMVSYAKGIYLSLRETSQAPVSTLMYANGSYLLTETGGYMLASDEVNEDWELILENGKNGVSILFQGSFPAAPANPKDGWSYYNTSDKRSYVYQGGKWHVTSVDGKDGKGFEWIFTRTKTNEKPIALTSEQKDDYVPAGWTDDPVGCTAEYIYEWTCKRVKKDGVWGAYSTASIFNMYSFSTIPQWSTNNVDWHDVFAPGDIYIRYSSDGGKTWTAGARAIGETGKEGPYTDFEFAVGESDIQAPTNGWSDAPSAVPEGQYLWMRTQYIVPPASVNPDAWKYSRLTGTTGSTGPVGIIPCGHWQSANTPYKKTSLVTMHNATFVALVDTAKPPVWLLKWGPGPTDYLINHTGGYTPLTSVENNRNTEWLMITPPPVNGTDGNDGNDSTSYWLTSPVSTININSVGSLSPSSVLISCKKKKGEGAVTDCSEFYLVVRKYNGSWLAHVSPVKASSISVNAVEGYTQFTVRAYNSESEANSWGNGFVAEIGVGVSKDGATGDTGPAGSFPRDRGEFVAGTSYVWSPSYRDKILYPFDGVYYNFLVGNFGATVTEAPTSASGDELWEAMGKYKSIATDTLFADGANVAHFMFRNGILRSQDETNSVPNLEMNGKTGKIKGIDVELSGKIEAKEDSQIAGMKVVGNSLRGVQAIMGIYKRQITGTGSVADRDIIVNNILQQQTYIFSITTAGNDVRVNLPSHREMIQKGIDEYQFEITIILDNGSVGSSIQIRCNDDALIVHGIKSFSSYGLGKGGVLKLLYFQNRYYLVSNSYAQTSPW